MGTGKYSLTSSFKLFKVEEYENKCHLGFSEIRKSKEVHFIIVQNWPKNMLFMDAF